MGERDTGLDIKAKKKAGPVDLFSPGDLPRGPKAGVATCNLGEFLHPEGYPVQRVGFAQLEDLYAEGLC